ncbi:MAG TPA: fatty acid--CoA ligase family protein [Methylomirabilota bacterium]|nr:fatty acid--CoA ligase family protein [Methylomirabilota bacterium]
MLYERWRDVVTGRRHEIALRELATDRAWTFAQLAAAAEHHPAPAGPVAHPCGSSAQFILDTLAAWREGRVVCPLEGGQAVPALGEPPSGVVHLKSTSATTGAPRLVAFTAGQLAADAENVVLTMGLRPDWPNLGCISLAHSYGFSNLVTPLLLHGIPLFLMASTLPETLRQVLARFSEVTLPAVPALWRLWHEAGVITPRIRLAISAGAPLPLNLESSVHAGTGVKLHNFYGATECGGIAYDPSATPRTEEGLAGQAMRNVHLSVNREGCLEVRGAAVGQCYWPEPADSLGDGRYRTQDLAELSNGVVFLRGRAGDVINVAGRKVSPEAIERVLRRYPGVRECLVLGIPEPDSGRGESIAACVVARPEDEAELKRFAREQLPDWQVPRRWCFVESLEANQRGKVSRAEWRRRLLDGAPG